MRTPRDGPPFAVVFSKALAKFVVIALYQEGQRTADAPPRRATPEEHAGALILVECSCEHGRAPQADTCRGPPDGDESRSLGSA